jgi:two-component system chemotaxis response regulator CheY
MTWSILIVDDSQSARAQLKGPLQEKGVRVIEAENGQEGLWRAREQAIDLVLADIHMPVMDGLTMVHELRQLPEYVTTPIIILTSDAAASRIAEGKKAGADAWMIKPVRPDLLWKAIEKALFGRPPSAQRRGAVGPAKVEKK